MSDVKMKKNRKLPKFLKSMENEIIVAVSALYLIIVSIILVVHFMQPSDQETQSSSTSVSHTSKNNKD